MEGKDWLASMNLQADLGISILATVSHFLSHLQQKYYFSRVVNNINLSISGLIQFCENEHDGWDKIQQNSH